MEQNLVRRTGADADALPIRAATDLDFDAAYRLYGQLSPRVALASQDLARDHSRQILALPGTAVFGADAEGLVGMATLHLMPNIRRLGRPYGVLENLVVDAGWRGLGRGRRIVGAVRDAFEVADACRLGPHVGAVRGVTGFYEALGFQHSHLCMQIRWDWMRGARDDT